MFGKKMHLKNFRPRPQLVTKTTLRHLPRWPVVDAHNHLDSMFGGGWIDRSLSEMHAAMDEAGVTHLVDLDGGWGEDVLRRHLDKLGASGRFRIFGGVEWATWKTLGDGFPEYAARRLEIQKGWGATGLKIWKPLGLHVTDERGRLVSVDDTRLSPIWQAAGNLGLPVMIHVADPAAFFDPVDQNNERWEELSAYPQFSFSAPRFPRFMEIVGGLRRLVANFPETTFIGAHVGCYSENLEWVGQMLDDCPNYYIDISGRLGELGRQPYSARRFLLRYSDRILFGMDNGIDVDGYRLWYRFLETDDEYFNYSVGEVPLQGRWFVSGVYLPDDVLDKIYRRTAQRVLALS
jgi:predicted TIM-barrel fold metal-dependent hydrolase